MAGALVRPPSSSPNVSQLAAFWQKLKLNPRAVDSITNFDPVLLSSKLLLAYSTDIHHKEQQQNRSSLAQPRIRCVLFLFRLHIGMGNQMNERAPCF